ncbi:MAG: magnesium-dependent phosphatase-1 [Bacteroidetes bacterium GWF2_42_66]|nr:MAG: magnesium-dependent phosphatase-1 [Bacteroidetes bacterium GWA2_42_15]OFX99486.1 MAG: magnesium-dependent phosphatase-1 [Bacteroidetes bacterium GWE2_42_39]OFY47017.1 MAG: magnesium-dependent phosphatase-1 [Bacteroidetes bacterium GWF2_42_66]HAZ04279.1 magnesium-dependent phosphatase-1 [Marinilabiliales bacterium]HBL76826.1 magnesium-dependent phosphatase-1 [Prolixibacteraceae bacterium]
MEVFVFDLDFTIWNAGDTFCSETSPPYFWNDEQLFDQQGRWIRLYPDSVGILKRLKKAGKILAVASRTNEPEWAKQLLQLFDIEKYFDIMEIYPGSKVTHLKNIQEKVGCPFDQIVFFDDEERNIQEVSLTGVKCVYVKNGLSFNYTSLKKGHYKKGLKNIKQKIGYFQTNNIKSERPGKSFLRF